MSYKLRSIQTGEFRDESFETRRMAEKFVCDLLEKGFAAAMYLKIVPVLA